MWCDNDLGEPKQGAVSARLAVKHVKCCASNRSGRNTCGEIVFDHDATTGNIDHSKRRLGRSEKVSIDQADGLRCSREVNGEEVTYRYKVFEREKFNANLLCPIFRDERVERHDSHLKRSCPVGDKLANSSETHDAKCFVGELNTFPLRSFPAAIDKG